MPKPRRDIQAIEEATLTPPDHLAEGQKIARVKNAAGNNLYNVELPSGEGLLAELAAKFRSVIWIKRGSYVLVDTSSLADRSNKLSGEIINVVRDEKAWKRSSFWPAEFRSKQSVYHSGSDDEEEEDGPKMPSDDDDDD